MNRFRRMLLLDHRRWGVDPTHAGSDRIDALARTLSSRRTALGGLLGGLAGLLALPREEASAHDPRPACKRITDPVRRRRCLRRAKAHNRNRHTCRPQSPAVTCAGRCGSTRNNCGQRVSCTCPADTMCLPNRLCSRFCDFDDLPCPEGCTCGIGVVELPGTPQCYPSTITECEQIPIGCSSTLECPAGHYCGGTLCPGSALRCVPVCPI